MAQGRMTRIPGRILNNLRFEVHKSYREDKWYWRLVAKNGKIVADGSEGYANRSNCTRAINKLKRQCLFIESFEIIYLS